MANTPYRFKRTSYGEANLLINAMLELFGIERALFRLCLLKFKSGLERLPASKSERRSSFAADM
jgi:hypothetical protein